MRRCSHTRISVHFGQNQSGHTLPQVMPDFREKFVKPVIQFAKGVFRKCLS